MARSLLSANNTNVRCRKTYLVYHYPCLNERLSSFHHQLLLRNERYISERDSFFSERPYNNDFSVNICGRNALSETSDALKFWAEENSFYICDNCNSVVTVNLPYNFKKKLKPREKNKCNCRSTRYLVPRYNCIPNILLNLSIENIKTLRPFDIDCGFYSRQSHGYRVKTGMITLKLSTSVNEKIRSLSCPIEKEKCQKAYEYLMSSNTSHYSHFIQLQNDKLRSGETINCYDFFLTEGIECALWPNIYPFSSWCESIICGKESRLSMKASFCAKLFSEILDYGLHFDLLQWQYERALYKVVSGAINTARYRNCSPARALDTKTFSPTYWQWQHLYLLDAIEQFGLPSVFITISPYEWTFPFARWISAIRYETGLDATQLPAFETFHIAHVLEQIIRGYLTGSNCNKWSQHVFSYNRSSSQQNINTYFYRFEFQKRGTLHVHMLIWLKDLTKMQHHLVRADIPENNTELSFLVHKLQPSDKASDCLNLQEQDSYIATDNDRQIHHIKHPAEAFALNLRAYIATLIPALKCRMDYQTTNGVAMLLKYVTSYVTKFQDSTALDSLYSYHLNGRLAATRYLMQNNPTEPEMYFFLQSKKIAWTNCRTKRYTVPTSDKVLEDKTAIKYWQRGPQLIDMSMKLWLRKHETNSRTPKIYKRGSTLVGFKMLSIFNKQFFFQYVFINLPHRKLSDFLSPQHEQLPDELKWFVAATFHFANLWKNNEKIAKYLSVQGHKESFISTVLSYICSLNDMYYLWQMNIIKTRQVALQQLSCDSIDFALDSWQAAASAHVKRAVSTRDLYYRSSFTNRCEL